MITRSESMLSKWNNDKVDWAISILREKAFGGKINFELDEILPTLESEIEQLQKYKQAYDVFEELLAEMPCECEYKVYSKGTIKNICLKCLASKKAEEILNG